MKRILYVHQSAELYGSDKVLQFLVTGLAELGEFAPVVVLPEMGPLFDVLSGSGIEVHIADVAKISRSVLSLSGIASLILTLLGSYPAIQRIVAGRRIDLVHSNTLAVLAGAYWAWRRNIPHVWHVHELIQSPRLVSTWLPRIASMLSKRVIANSRQTLEWLVGAAPSLKGKSAVVFNGLPPSPAPTLPAVEAFRQRVGAGEGELVISLVGRINRWKGHRLVVAAAELLQQSGRLEGLRFAFVGSPAPGLEFLADELEADIKARGLKAHFSLIQFVDDVWPVWHGTDIGLVPSTDPEPFGMVAIEAMSVGVPVVVAGHGGLLDIVEQDKSGLVFAPGNAESLADAIWRLVSDAALRARLGDSGRCRQEKAFSLAAQLKDTAAVYNNTIQ